MGLTIRNTVPDIGPPDDYEDIHLLFFWLSARLEDDTVEVFWNQSGKYANPDDDARDHLWDELDIDSGVVAVPKTWAREKGLPEATTFPWDTDKALYFVNAYHSVHCLVSSP